MVFFAGCSAYDKNGGNQNNNKLVRQKLNGASSRFLGKAEKSGESGEHRTLNGDPKEIKHPTSTHILLLETLLLNVLAVNSNYV